MKIDSKKTIGDAIKLINLNTKGVCFVTSKGKLNGILTDGDIRRNSNNLFKKKILKVCSKNPTWVSETDTALSAIEKMNKLKITSLLVSSNKDVGKRIKNIVGVLHLHHCLARGIK